jgi:hypothetical protein
VRSAPGRDMTQLHEVRTAHEHESSVACVAHHRPNGGLTFLASRD